MFKKKLLVYCTAQSADYLPVNLPEVGLRLDEREAGTPKGLLCPSPRCPNSELTGNAGCPNIEKAPGRWARWANGKAAAIPGLNGEAPGTKMGKNVTLDLILLLLILVIPINCCIKAIIINQYHQSIFCYFAICKVNCFFYFYKQK